MLYMSQGIEDGTVWKLLFQAWGEPDGMSCPTMGSIKESLAILAV